MLPTAHDMRREHTVISALGPTGVPVPETLGLCTDESVNGAPFYVMSFVEGHIVRDERTAKGLTLSARARAGESLVDTLAQLHAVDVDAVGLGDFARRDGYIARQLKRWHGQFAQSTLDGQPGPAIVDRVHELLAARIPEQQGVAIVHGDYRLDNTVLDDQGEVRAILDWEICTLGDPLADLGLLMVYWAEPEDGDAALLGVAPTTLPGFARRADLLERYAAASGGMSPTSRTTGPSGSGSWPVSCKGCMSVTPAGPRPATGPEPASSRPTWAGSASWRWRRSSRCDRPGPTSIYDFDPEWGEPVDARLSRPVMVIGLEGWVDAGMGASAAIVELLTTSPTTTVASFDTELLIDQRARRPIVRLEDGVTTELTWPAIRIVAGKDRVGADILYLTGPEPDFRWPTFIEAVVGLVGHSTCAPWSGWAPSRRRPPTPDRSAWPPRCLRSRWSWPDGWAPCTGRSRSPPGCRPRSRFPREAGIPAIGLWARVPHYVSAMPYPEASAALDRGTQCGDRGRARLLVATQRRRYRAVRSTS